MNALARRVALGFAATVIVAVLGVFLKQPLVDAIVAGVRELPGFVAPADGWIDAHRVVFELATAATGAALAIGFATVIGERAHGVILLGGAVLGCGAGESVIGWMDGSVGGPVAAVTVGVLAPLWTLVAVRSAARWKRRFRSEERRRAIMRGDPYRYGPIRPGSPQPGGPLSRLSPARAAAYSASFPGSARNGG